jgi:isoleucyl-tRNA synthetase
VAASPGDGEPSVHLRLMPEISSSWRDDLLARKWGTVRAIRSVVTGALELERAAKRIGSSLQAAPTVYMTHEQREALAGLDLAEIAITSGVTLEEGAVPEAAFTLPDVPAWASCRLLPMGRNASAVGGCCLR